MILNQNSSRQSNIWLLCLLITIACSTRGICQTDSSDVSNPLINLASIVAGDVWHVTNQAVRVTKKDAIQLISFSILNAGLIYRGDKTIDEEFASERDQNYLKPAKALAEFGYLYDDIGTREIFAGSTLGFLIGGAVLKNKKMLHTSRLIFESTLITSAITFWSKEFFGRARPFTGDGPHEFNVFKFGNSTAYRALPSGHTSSAFAILTVIAKQYPQWWVKYPAYTTAVGVALQRLDDRKHWTSDVVIGGAIGYWVSKVLTDRYQKSTSNYKISPYVSTNQIGIRIGL